MDTFMVALFIGGCLRGIAWALDWVLTYAKKKGALDGKTMW